MNYKVTFENDSLVKIKQNSVCFSITKDTGTLYGLTNVGAPTDVIIPHTFPSGHQINYLNSTAVDNISCEGNMVQGRFETITISDGIVVGSEAFERARVKKVVWNDCTCIPMHCFYESSVEKIANICNVNKVMASAFAGCAIKEMTWPAHCDTIPAGCFADCKCLDEVVAPYVRRIRGRAFAHSSIVAFDWPTSCSEIPERCFFYSELTKIHNTDRITAIDELAFAYTKLEVLDLSDSNISYLAPGALSCLPKKCKVAQPYYVNDEDYANAFVRKLK